jgi:hypothetical protein
VKFEAAQQAVPTGKVANVAMRTVPTLYVGHVVDEEEDNYEEKISSAGRLTAVGCPHCNRPVVTLEIGYWEGDEYFEAEEEHVIWPLQSARPPIPPEVPAHLAADYKEAALVLNLSPKASAALSRRCLQAVLREAGNTNQERLVDQIKAVKGSLPSAVGDSLDAVRQIGNFAAHPEKDRVSGQILDVEPHEAEWNLDVLDYLFEHYYVQPARDKQRRDALNAKMAAAGKTSRV